MAEHPLTARWNLLTGIATPICTCIGGFLLLPPLDLSGGVKFGVFAVTLLIGLWLVPVQLYSTPRALPLWVASATAFVVLSISAFVLYNRVLDGWAFD
jgi:hypothetical protein